MKSNRWALMGALATALAAAACSHRPPPPMMAEPTTETGAPAAPGPKLRPESMVGNWGFAAYHRAEDRERVVTLAEGQCSKPFVIEAGANGGVLMPIADRVDPLEVFLKPGPDGYDLLGPPGPAGGAEDREISWYDGRVVVLRYLSPDLASRYGTAVLVRCVPPAPRVEQPTADNRPDQPLTAVEPEPEPRMPRMPPRHVKRIKGKPAAVVQHHRTKAPSMKAARGKPSAKPRPAHKPAGGAAPKPKADAAPIQLPPSRPPAAKLEAPKTNEAAKPVALPAAPYGNVANPADPKNTKSGP